MDELLIDEKKYISSKQAAKITGYAKDYIGQLCREGRVTARLVGRSWYVLESAIQDHRFGDEPTKQKEIKHTEEKVVESSWTRQSPKYEAAPVELLPKMREASNEPELDMAETSVSPQAPENLQSSWRAWFDRNEEAVSLAEPVEPTVEIEQVTVAEPQPEPEVTAERDVPAQRVLHDDYLNEVTIPIHTVYKAPPRELMPRYTPEEEVFDEQGEEVIPVRQAKKSGRVMIRTIKILAIVVAAITASLAGISTGYFDDFFSSSIQATEISGILTYIK